ARRSPVMSARMTYLVLNPSWNVPHKIAVQDKLPQFRDNPALLEQQGFEVLSGWAENAQPLDPDAIDWATLGPRNFPYRLRQRPGPQNALGRVKFMFPNKFDVYLHDTPARELFSREERAFSSGCIRVEHPLALALALLRDDPAWTPSALENAVAQGTERIVKLPQPILVHLLYWTAWVDPAGRLRFRRDLYGRDALLSEALREADGV
ncbi:MAG: L,D-transpeptidase family protein, partial [Pseudomonadota bacterium]|nr:L,D-transpeptidase family protein [Pseudomonadota bacterium]